jgi:hypothetical protein
MLHALLQDFIVVEIRDIADDVEYLELSSQYPMIVNIDGWLDQPAVGWVLDGSTLKPPAYYGPTPEQVREYQCKDQRIFGSNLIGPLVDKIGARNLTLIAEGHTVNIIAMVTALSSIRALLEGGALKTAISVIEASKGSFPLHLDLFNLAISEISDFLNLRGY